MAAQPGAEPPPTQVFLATLVVAALVLLGLTVGGAPATPEPGVFAPTDLEHRLAVHDGHRPDEPELRAYAAALDGAARRCGRSREEVASLAVAAEARAVDAATTRSLLARVAALAPPDATGCEDAFRVATRQAGRCVPHGDRPCAW